MRLIVCGLVLTVFAFPCWGATIIVDQNGAGDFTNIQDAIDYSLDGDTVLVRPGTYNQAINFNGRRITLTSLNPDDDNIVKSTIITAGNAVIFHFGEDSDSVITGFTIINPTQYAAAIDCYLAAPTILKNRISSTKGNGIRFCEGVISNNIISGCDDSILIYKGVIRNNIIVGSKGTEGPGYSGRGIIVNSMDVAHQIVVVKNNIIANNTCYGLGLEDDDVICDNSYNCFWNNNINYSGVSPGTGDFVRDPLFAIDGYWSGSTWVDGDYHLKSSAGRWTGTEWVLDDVNSPCIDAGDPGDSIGYEPSPNGGRINVGNYGGTSKASKSTLGVDSEPLTIKKCAVTAGNIQGQDCLNTSGTFAESFADFSGIDSIDVNVIALTGDDGNPELIYEESIPFENSNVINGKYKYSRKFVIGQPGFITSLAMDFNKKNLSLKSKNIDLTGLEAPLQLNITLGSYTLSDDANEAIVNGSKLIPIRLMRTHEDTLRIKNAKAKNSSKASSDSLSVKGDIAVSDMNLDTNEPNLVTKEVIITWSNVDDTNTQTFAIPQGSFKASKKGHLYKCSKINPVITPIEDVNTLVTARIDLDKCTFTVSIIKSDLDVLSGDVKFGLSFAAFDEVVDLNLQ